MKKKLTFAAALLAASVLGGMANAKQLVYCSEAAPAGFDPSPWSGGNDFDASSRTIYSRLVEFEHGKTTITPGLAESWTVSDDGLEYTFKLRPGVKFQTTDYFTPTRDLNADDVIFSFERQWKKESPWYDYLAGTGWEYFAGMGFPDLLKEIVKVDDLTVKFVLNKPEVAFLPDLGMDFASIVSKEYADQLDKADTRQQFTQKPIGTGPFQFVDYQVDAVIRYAAWDGYYGGRQKIDDLIFAITKEPAAAQEALKAGQCDVIPYPIPGDVDALMTDPNLVVTQTPGENVGFIAYNTQQAPFDNPKVRQALNMAVNKQAILDAVYQGAGQAAINPIPPTMWSYNKDIKDDPYDPDAAKKMLADAGVKDLSMKIWAMPVSRPYNPNAQRVAELIQADYAKIGVKAEIVSYEWTEYRERGKQKDRDGAFQLGWTGDNGDPDNFLFLLGCDAIGQSNYAIWCNQEFEALLQKGKATTDVAERTKIYEEAQVVFKREAPWLTIAHSKVFMPMNKKVSGFVMDPLGIHRFDGVDVAE